MARWTRVPKVVGEFFMAPKFSIPYQKASPVPQLYFLRCLQSNSRSPQTYDIPTNRFTIRGREPETNPIAKQAFASNDALPCFALARSCHPLSPASRKLGPRSGWLAEPNEAAHGLHDGCCGPLLGLLRQASYGGFIRTISCRWPIILSDCLGRERVLLLSHHGGRIRRKGARSGRPRTPRNWPRKRWIARVVRR